MTKNTKNLPLSTKKHQKKTKKTFFLMFNFFPFKVNK